jgi:hypothetical protein
MVNVEELPPRPFLALMAKMGLTTWVREGERDVLLEEQAETVGV